MILGLTDVLIGMKARGAVWFWALSHIFLHFFAGKMRTLNPPAISYINMSLQQYQRRQGLASCWTGLNFIMSRIHLFFGRNRLTIMFAIADDLWFFLCLAFVSTRVWSLLAHVVACKGDAQRSYDHHPWSNADIRSFYIYKEPHISVSILFGSNSFLKIINFVIAKIRLANQTERSRQGESLCSFK
jgi:hypothetical protein